MFVITLGDVFGITVFVITVLAIACVGLVRWWRQRRCRHDRGVNETQACDAICRSCGKNLGFIGSLRR